MLKVGLLVTESPDYNLTNDLLIKHFKLQDINYVLITDNKRCKRRYPQSKLIEKKLSKCNGDLKLPLIRYIFSDIDRSIRSNIHIKINDLKNILSIKREVESILLEEGITHVIYEPPSNAFSMICKEVSEELGIKYLGMINARIKNMVMVEGLERTDELNQHLSYERLKAIFAAPPSYMEYMKQSSDNLFKLFLRAIVFIPKIIKLEYYKNIDNIEYCWYLNELNFEWKTLKVSLEKKINNIEYSKIDNTSGIKNNYLYFMQYAPESSVSILGWPWVSQLQIVYDILLNIDNNATLYIKEHPSQSILNDAVFYRYIKTIPNIKILSHEENIDKILESIRYSFTVSSTAGLRSLFNDVPVIVFGDSQDLRNISGVYDYNDFKNKEYNLKVDRNQLTLDMNSYLNRLFKGQVYSKSAVEIEKFIIELVDVLRCA
jgi:hypothetical protein